MKRTTCATLAALALTAALFAQEAPAKRRRPRLTAKDEAMRLAAGLTAEAALVAGRLAACGAEEAAAQLKAAEERAAAEAAAGKLEAANTKRRAALSLARETLAARTATAKTPAAVVPARAAKPHVLPAGVPRELAAARTLLDTLEAGCARGTAAPAECGELLARARAGFEHAKERLAAGDPEGAKLARETTRELATAVAQYAHASAGDDEEPETGRM